MLNVWLGIIKSSQLHGGNLFLKLSDMTSSFSLGHITANYFIRPWRIGHSLSWLRWDGLDGIRTKTRWNVNLNWAPLTNRMKRYETFWTGGFPQEYLATLRSHCRLKLNMPNWQPDRPCWHFWNGLLNTKSAWHESWQGDRPDWIDLGAFH